MPDYRFYQLARGRIIGADVHDCADDEDARATAARLLIGASPVCDGIEIWLLSRLVGTVNRQESQPPPDPAP
ncbi:MAG: hypothetical protein ACREFQ_22335 [Stellaceae bacterium]